MNMNNISVFNILIIIVILVIVYKSLPVIINFLKRKKIQNLYRKARIHDVDKMDGIEFEYYLEALFSKLKYKPTVTKASHDYGAD